MEYVTIVNRSTKTLFGMFDGREYKITPGKHSYPRNLANKFKSQNPIMGTGMFGDTDTRYLIGIEEDNDPCDPIEQSDAIEAYDARKLHGHKQVEVVRGNNGLFSRGDLGSVPLGNDSKFVKP